MVELKPTPQIVPLDSLTLQELKHLIGKSAEGLTTMQINMIAAGLAHQQDKEGLRHEKAQAWEQGRSDYIMSERTPWIRAHLINPYDVVSDDGQAVDTTEQTG